MHDAERWRRYFDAAGLDPRRTALDALAAWGDAPPGRAVDLGCGTGRDALALLAAGWTVTAIDGETVALERLAAKVPDGRRSRLTTLQAKFEDLTVPPADLVNASFSLPFCKPDAFPALWQGIRDAIAPGGLFAGHLFGPHDDWAGTGITVHDREAVAGRLAGWEVLRCDEQDAPGKTALGESKHWHLFEIVARVPKAG